MHRIVQRGGNCEIQTVAVWDNFTSKIGLKVFSILSENNDTSIINICDG